MASRTRKDTIAKMAHETKCQRCEANSIFCQITQQLLHVFCDECTGYLSTFVLIG